MHAQSFLKERLIDPAIETGDLAALERAVPLWKTSIDAQKGEVDIADAAFKRRSESIRFWVPILAPLLGATALVATLTFQVYQFRQNARLAATTAEDTGWREVLNRARNTTGPDAAFAMTLIKSFLDSDRYAKSAREISVSILAHMADSDAFLTLFLEVERRTTLTNINDISRIGAGLNRHYQSIPDSEKDPKVIAAKQQLGENMQRVAKALGALLREHGAALEDAGAELDLSGVQFGTVDLSGVPFSRVRLNDATFFNCTLAGATLVGISEFEDSEWQNTAWWRAKKIDPKLLSYLERTFPYKEGVEYPKDTTRNVTDYQEALAGLRGNAAH